MLFSLICHDIENGLELRQQTRPAHLAFLAEHDVCFAGPMLSDDESKPIGSIVVIDCKDFKKDHPDDLAKGWTATQPSDTSTASLRPPSLPTI